MSVNQLVATLDNHNFGNYDNLTIWHNAAQQAIWFSMAVTPRPCFTWNLVRDIMRFQHAVKEHFSNNGIRYLVLASSSQDVFSFGGDLQLFRELIAEQKRPALSAYAMDCVTVLYNHAVSLHLPITSIALVEGDALGAGFETALASNVLIAERGTKLGFPETLFNLIPGHGAYNLLCRRIGAKAAKEMILGGKLYSAEALYEMKLIDVLADRGAGRNAVDAYILQQNKLWNAYYALQRVQQTYQPLTREELQCSAEIWVDAALQVRPAHLRIMDKLIRAQTRVLSQVALSEKNRRPTESSEHLL
ncbi:MAG: crotonase/enoyl-CoA hydratase family protein [Gammaproteobacteria bacterium]|nr:crotonase/enoyl-CoA hydratase family protein [Gammaproteobacteria bacterium]